MNHIPDFLMARLGGIPCDLMQTFLNRLEAEMEMLAAAESSLKRCREQLVSHLHTTIRDEVGDTRHMLLAVKRDCFNGRSLRSYPGSESWLSLEKAAGSLVNLVLQREQEMEERWMTFTAHYKKEFEDQCRLLAEALHDPMLACGLAVASPVVARESHRLHEKPPAQYGRRERRLIVTLLRYLSRAALKLSPFSTFTTVAEAQTDESVRSLSLTAGGRSIRSLVRLRRHILDRCADLLIRYPPWRNQVQVVLNESILPLDDGKILYWRPPFYSPDPKEKRLSYNEEAMVRVRLAGRLTSLLQLLLAGKSLAYGHLISCLYEVLREKVDSSTIVEQVDRLIEIGFLCFRPPWSSNDPHLERSMFAALGSLPADPALDEFQSILKNLIALEHGFLESRDQLSSVLQMERMIDDLLQGAATLGRVPPDIKVTKRPSEHDIYHDVWCSPKASNAEAMVRIQRGPLDEAIRCAQPLIRYARLFDHRLEFLLTLSVHLKQHSAGNNRFPVLQAFDTIRPLWQHFMKFQVQIRETPNWRRAWNPKDLPDIEELTRYRDLAYEGINNCLRISASEQRIDIDAMNQLLDGIPVRFTDNKVGACLFLQPAASDGTLWIVNRLKEGTGRFYSRYTPVMPAPLRARYEENLIKKGKFNSNGLDVQLLDIQCTQGDTLNVHTLQTPKILLFPGEDVHASKTAKITLQDLYIVLGADGWPQVCDGEGQCYLPLYLGGAYHDYLPTLVKFLCCFGPTEIGAVFPAPLEGKVADVVVQERTVIGNLVLSRKTWHVPINQLKKLMNCPNDEEAFFRVHGWRQRYGIPGQLFVYDRVAHPIRGTRYRPQYLDLTSPLFLSMLRAIVDSGDAFLSFAEMLPSIDMFPVDEDGRAWATEVLVDSLTWSAKDSKYEILRRLPESMAAESVTTGPPVPR